MTLRRRTTALAALASGATALALLTVPGTGAAAAGTFGAPVLVGTGASEPGINVAPDGTVYVNGPGGLLSNLPGSPSLVFRSDDGAGSFHQLPAGLKADLPGGGDSNIAVAPDGTLSETDLYLANSTVSVSKDKGQSWTAQPLQGVIVQDRQWVAATSGGRVYHAVHQIPSGIVVSRSLDSGLTYPQQNLGATVADQGGCICPPGNIIAEDGGLLGDKAGGVYATSTGGVGFYRSTNGGLTFTNTRPGPDSSDTTNFSFPVVADGGNGKLAVVWAAETGSATVVKLATSADFGATWNAPKVIVSGGTSTYPWVDYRAGKIAVSVYHNATAAPTPDQTPSGAPWYVNYLASTDGGNTFSTAAVADPTPVKTQGICTGGTSCTTGRELGDFQTVALNATGQALISYVRSPNNTYAGTAVFVVKGG